jgi:RNA polymerase sigma-70 factor (ECF subfamily)
MLPTDQPLFRLIAVQNESAFNEIYYKYQPLLFTCVKKMLRNDQYAEDIIHEIFITLWQGGEQLKEIRNPAGWLRRLAANKTIDHLRQEKANRQFKRLLADTPGFTEGYEEIHFKELQVLLQKAINKLSLDEGMILRASIEQGLSRQQIAEQLDLPVNTVKNKLEHGRRVLREYVKEYSGVYLPWVLIAVAVS